MRDSGLVDSHMQYADHTLLIGTPTLHNLWTKKAVLGCFDLASGLKVNFSKSSILGVNVSPLFLSSAERIRHCNIRVVPFKYLGLPVGANPHRLATWEPLVGLLRCKISS